MKFDDISVIPQPTEDRLNQRQIVDYRTEREDCFEWLLAFGKDPQRADGYARTTVRNRSYRMDQFYRWVWEHDGRYTLAVSHEHADEWMQQLARGDYSDTHLSLCQRSVQMLFKWRAHERGDTEWDPEIRFSSSSQTAAPRDYLTLEERRMIRSAALEYGSIPTYDYATDAERDRWNAYLAQRFEKPKTEVTEADWDRANGWKIPTLVNVSLDAGLRPIEVDRAVVSWVDLDNGLLRIPKEDSSKNEHHWRVGLADKTVSMLDR
jgi:hypothetical protein